MITKFKLIHFNFVFIFLSLFANCNIIGQIQPKVDAIIAKLSVSTYQEQNFNAFMAWLDKHESLKLNEGLKNGYQAVFNAMKQNDYSEYIVQCNKLSEETAKVNDEERISIYQFFLTLPYKSGGPEPLKPPGENSCEVSCTFGSCSIQCPAGTKPKCFCDFWGHPQCGCEPY